MHIAVEVSSSDNRCAAEPVTMFHEASVNLADVIVRTLSPDRTSPDREQIKINCPLNPNGNYPFAERLAHHLKRVPLPAKDCKPLVRISPEPKAREAVAIEDID